MRIVFMGTPDFAVPSLEMLVENGYDVVGVITATDKLGGRGGKKLIESAVKKFAQEKGIPVLQPKNLKNPDFQSELRALQADLQVVVAFRMLPVAVWDMPPIGTFNLHGSLLPAYRGAAPINWAVINGEKETGVTTFFLKHEIDTGDVLFQESMPIHESDTAGDVHDRMMVLGAQVVLKTVQAIEKGDYTLQPQDDSKVSKAPKIYRETCQIDFDKDCEEVYNFVRGMSPFPTAWTQIDGEELKVYAAEMERSEHELPPGTLQTDNKRYLKIATQGGFLVLKQVKLQGRKKMDVSSFLNGYKIQSTKA
ncbi:MAG: methionyl-tRNA formyltransferase [Bacteroidota bacterium]